MAPLIAALMKFGLGVLGNAVLAKGKEAVQEKLGVDLDDMLGSEAGRIELQKLQAQHEQALLAMAIEHRKLDLQHQAMAHADTASARDMNTRVNESAHASPLAKNIAAVLALVVILSGFAILAWSPNADVRTAAVGLMTLVLGFYFGTSVGSQRKDATIARLSEGVGP